MWHWLCGLLPSIQTPTAAGISDCLSVFKLDTHQGSVKLINTYAPTLTADPEDKDEFCNKLGDTFRTTSDSDERTILIGDMNARISADDNAWPGCNAKFRAG